MAAVSIEGLVRRSFTLSRNIYAIQPSRLPRINPCRRASSFLSRKNEKDKIEESKIFRPKESVPTVGNAGAEKAEKISSAMKAYLERKKEHDKFMDGEIADYEIGKRHLAAIMSIDPDSMTQDDIDRAIQYLLPSGVFDKKARPQMKHPYQTIPQQKAAQFSADGRPYDSMFYTGNPIFYKMMHDTVAIVEELKEFETKMLHKGFVQPSENKLNLLGSEWINKLKLEDMLKETISDDNYNSFILLFEHLAGLTYANRQKEFIFKYRTQLIVRSDFFRTEELKVGEDGRRYQTASGRRKNAKASVKVVEAGRGDMIINDMEMLEFFPRYANRRQLLFPLQLSGLLGAVDVEAQVEEGGPTGQAGAIRLALSRALSSFVDHKVVERMRLAGLLTVDPRRKERKKVGQEGARRKFTWKKR